ncbi:hypothetical protein DPMN_104485 [Dreissena polymorpha]|uniref:Uncharacterized protein n=1 Tax=Dreissena polymorpha TaxID=45954 RepID=A0A9D4HC45_DREPO|nr:hypothetical protein DPMN_104485 [Dreissena polymorpha]
MHLGCHVLIESPHIFHINHQYGIRPDHTDQTIYTDQTRQYVPRPDHTDHGQTIRTKTIRTKTSPYGQRIYGPRTYHTDQDQTVLTKTIRTKTRPLASRSEQTYQDQIY